MDMMISTESIRGMAVIFLCPAEEIKGGTKNIKREISIRTGIKKRQTAGAVDKCGFLRNACLGENTLRPDVKGPINRRLRIRDDRIVGDFEPLV
jgi:hypothetical protein